MFMRLVRVALAGGTVTEEGERDDRVVLDLRGHREPHRVQRLRGQRGRQRGHPVLVRVEAAVPAAREEREQLDDVDAARERAHGLAIGREEPVVGLEREDRTHLGCLLAVARGEDPERSLAGQVDRLAVDAAAQRHEAIEAAELVRGQVDVVREAPAPRDPSAATSCQAAFDGPENEDGPLVADDTSTLTLLDPTPADRGRRSREPVWPASRPRPRRRPDR